MSDQVVPELTANVPIAGLADLQNHLEQLEANPELPFDVKLFDDVELQLNGRY